MKILVVDNTPDGTFLNVVNKYFSAAEIVHQTNRDISFKSIPHDFYDVIVSSEGIGRLKNDDIIDFIKESRTVRRSVIICIDHNPRVRANLMSSLKPYRGFVLDVDELNTLENILAGLT